MTDITNPRLQRIQAAAAASRRAGYRTTPPPDGEADRWVCSVQAGEDEYDHPVHRLIWYPRKEVMAWQNARFGPSESVPTNSAEPAPAGEHNGQEERDGAQDDSAGLVCFLPPPNPEDRPA